MTRQIALDLETTGLSGTDRIVEIGCVELNNGIITGTTLQYYLNPEQDIHPMAIQVHGLTTEFLADQPRFAQIEAEFIKFIKGAELLIHNAPFDTRFLDYELSLTNSPHHSLTALCSVSDTLALARTRYPGEPRHKLNTLCHLHGIDTSARDLHGALLDAKLLAQVYQAMMKNEVVPRSPKPPRRTAPPQPRRPVVNKAARTPKKPLTKTVWRRICARESKKFKTKTGLPFKYKIEGNAIVPDRPRGKYPIEKGALATGTAPSANGWAKQDAR